MFHLRTRMPRAHFHIEMIRDWLDVAPRRASKLNVYYTPDY